MQIVNVQPEEATAAACSYRGALLLDELAPGWAHRVTDRIVMIDPNHCVAGQVFADKEEAWGSGYGYLQHHLFHVKNEPIRQTTAPATAYGVGYREYSPTMWYGFSGDMDILERCWDSLISERL